MFSSAYNGFFISARAVIDSTLGSRTPMATISITEGGDSIMGIYSTDAFSTDEDAEAYGIRIAEEWIDKNLRVTPLVKKEIDRNETRAAVMTQGSLDGVLPCTMHGLDKRVLIGLAVLFYAARGIGQETTTASPDIEEAQKPRTAESKRPEQQKSNHDQSNIFGDRPTVRPSSARRPVAAH